MFLRYRGTDAVLHNGEKHKSNVRDKKSHGGFSVGFLLYFSGKTERSHSYGHKEHRHLQPAQMVQRHHRGDRHIVRGGVEKLRILQQDYRRALQDT